MWTRNVEIFPIIFSSCFYEILRVLRKYLKCGTRKTETRTMAKNCEKNGVVFLHVRKVKIFYFSFGEIPRPPSGEIFYEPDIQLGIVPAFTRVSAFQFHVPLSTFQQEPRPRDRPPNPQIINKMGVRHRGGLG